MMSAHSPDVVWRQLHWTRPLDADVALNVVRSWAVNQGSHPQVLEVRADEHGIRYLLGGDSSTIEDVSARYINSAPEVRLTRLARPRSPVVTARRLRISSKYRLLRVDDPVQVARTVLGALTDLRTGETLVVQIVLGPRQAPLAVPNNSSASVVLPWWQVLWTGNGGQIDGEKRSALRAKVADHGFAATV